MKKTLVLLIEDNQGDVMLVEEALRLADIDYDLRTVGDAETAELVLSGQRESDTPPPDIIFLDLNLPRGDGFELLAIARRNPAFRGVPIVVLSSSVSPVDRDRTLRLGATRYIQKPSTLDDFLSTVGDTVRRLTSPDAVPK